MTLCRLAAPLVAALVVGVGCRAPDPHTAGRASAASTWVTEPEFRFGNTPDGVFFTRPAARVDSPRGRVLVLDGMEVSVWTRTGDLLFVVGGTGDGPGEFRRPGILFVHRDGSFTVPDQHGARMTRFAADGELLEAEQGPGGRVSYEGFPLAVASSRNGIFLGHASIPVGLEEGVPGVDPMDRQPVLRVRESEPGEWHPPEPVLWLDVRNRAQDVDLGGGRGFYTAQPFGDWDLVAYAPGAVVAVRRNRGPGEVDVVEVSATGDTVWQRRLQFEPRHLTPQMIEHRTETMIKAMPDSVGPHASRRLPREPLPTRIRPRRRGEAGPCRLRRSVAREHRGRRHVQGLLRGGQGHGERTSTSRAPPRGNGRHRRQLHPCVGVSARRNGCPVHRREAARGMERSRAMSVRGPRNR